MRRAKKVIACLFVAVFVFTMFLSQAEAASAKSGNNSSKYTAAQVLSTLTEEQREALVSLTENDFSGLYLEPDVNLNDVETVSVIVQFKNKPQKLAVIEAALEGTDLSADEAKQKVNNDHKTFKQDLNSVFSDASAGEYKVIREYEHVFNGVALEVPANKITEIEKSSVVQAIFSNSSVTVAPPEEEETDSYASSGQGMEAERAYLRIDELHEEGYTGKGVKVAVIDTGCDYNHPDIAPAYRGGYDFVDNDNDPMEATYQDYLDYNKANPTNRVSVDKYITMHGTHVSGIIAGQGINDSPYATTGVAPDAELYVYRVLGPGGTGYSDDILAGIEQAVVDGMDVVNMSLGANYNYPYYLTSIAVNNAVLCGVTVVVSAGNLGENGMYTLGSPGSAALAITVGASDVPQIVPTFHGQLDDLSLEIRGLGKGWSDSFEGFLGQTLELVNVPNYGAIADYRSLDVKGKTVLVQRGGNISLYDKTRYAKMYGAASIIIWNDNSEEGFIPFYLGELPDTIPAFNISYADGIALQNKIAEGCSQLTLADSVDYSTPIPGDNLGIFSSRGPARITYDIKPEIVAPGVAVLSTIPGFVRNHDNPSDYAIAYERMDGTSMAAPFVTGVSALLLQAKPELEPSDVKAILMNTADPLSDPYSVFEQGAGRVDPYEAIHTSIEIKVKDSATNIVNNKERNIKDETGAISFGNVVYDGKDFKDFRKVTIENHGSKAKTFDVEILFQTGLGADAKDAALNGVSLKTDSSITVKKNGSVNQKVTLNIPKTAEKGIYEGYIVYTNREDSTETYRIPFAVHYVEEGFESYSYLYDKTTTKVNYLTNLIFDPAIYGQFILKSHMDYLYQVVIDESGKEIGVSGAFDGLFLNEGVEYTLSFDGTYYPFTGDKDNSIDFHKVYAPEGFYKLKLLGYNSDGDAFETPTVDVIVDSTMPDAFDVYMEGEEEGNPFVEYEPGTESILMTASLHDEGIAGQEVDQSKNFLFYYYNSFFPSGTFQLDENGACEIQVPTDPNGRLIDFEVEGVDQASNTFGRKYYFLVPNDFTYVYGKPNRDTRLGTVITKPGETVTYTLTANNVKDLKEAVYDLSATDFDKAVTNVTLNPAAEALGATLTWKVTPSYGLTRHNIVVSFNQEEGVNGDIPMVDVTVEMKETDEYQISSVLECTSKFTSVDGIMTRPHSWIALTLTMYDISTAYGQIYPETFIQDEKGTLKYQDYTKSGIEISVMDSQGNTYPGTLNRYGGFTVAGLPVTHDSFTLIQDIPGHFTTYSTFTNFYQVFDGVEYGIGRKLIYPDEMEMAAGGDVNKDNVIDLNDALAIKACFGAKVGDEAYDRNADINWDGVIDEKDFAIVEMNYGTQNPTVENAPKPLTKLKGKTISDIKKDLGI